MHHDKATQNNRPSDSRPAVVDEVVHYCVANMPGAVARTSTLALNDATLPHVLQIASKGVRKALEDNPICWRA